MSQVNNATPLKTFVMTPFEGVLTYGVLVKENEKTHKGTVNFSMFKHILEARGADTEYLILVLDLKDIEFITDPTLIELLSVTDKTKSCDKISVPVSVPKTTTNAGEWVTCAKTPVTHKIPAPKISIDNVVGDLVISDIFGHHLVANVMGVSDTHYNLDFSPSKDAVDAIIKQKKENFEKKGNAEYRVPKTVFWTLKANVTQIISTPPLRTLADHIDQHKSAKASVPVDENSFAILDKDS